MTRQQPHVIVVVYEIDDEFPTEGPPAIIHGIFTMGRARKMCAPSHHKCSIRWRR